jgi:hypothetical protein
MRSTRSPNGSLNDSQEYQVTVTRTELANHIQAAFTTGPATRDILLAYAAGSHARPEVIAALHRLTDKPYPSIRDLWQDLADLPVSN